MNRGIFFGIIAMATIVVASNILVQFLMGNWLTWGAFTYPFAFLITDLMNRLYGAQQARKVVFTGFLVGILCSFIGTQIMGEFGPYVTLRIAIGSGTAFLVAQLVDVFIFNKMRMNMQNVHSPRIELATLTITYFLLWIVFSITAVILQYILHNMSLINMMGTINNNHIAATLIVLAGIYQFTDLKSVCLEKCRNPLSYIMGTKINNFKDIISIGISNGLFCIGCCWVLMLLLFVNGVMNLLWVLVIAIAVLAEKVFPYGNVVSKLFGISLISWGSLIFLFEFI